MGLDAAPGSKIPIKIDKNLLGSDHGILGVVAHELWEIMNLHNTFKYQPNKTLTGKYLHNYLIGPDGSLHQQAWGIHDDVIGRIKNLPWL